MKKYNNLFEQICSYENFQLAYVNAIKGKKHYKEVIEIEKNRDEFLRNLADSVRNKTYCVSDYTIFKLWSGNKWREIYKLPMVDRIVLHAIMIYCEPIFRESFIIDTYASIKHRGIHRGLLRLKRALKDSQYVYALQLDIHHCYPSIDQTILKQKLRKKFKDKDLLWLLDTIIDSCEKGVPIGNYTSLYFNNFYFSDFDHMLKEKLRIKYYFRYCDDMIIFGRTKLELRKIFKQVVEYLSSLNVQIKSNYRIFPISVKGVNFLGYISYYTHRRIRKLTKLNFIKKTKCLQDSLIVPRCLNVIGSYWGIMIHGDCRNLWFKYTNKRTLKDLNLKLRLNGNI